MQHSSTYRHTHKHSRTYIQAYSHVHGCIVLRVLLISPLLISSSQEYSIYRDTFMLIASRVHRRYFLVYKSLIVNTNTFLRSVGFLIWFDELWSGKNLRDILLTYQPSERFRFVHYQETRILKCWYFYVWQMFDHLSIYGIYIAPLRGNYSEALPAQARAKRKVLRRL